MKEFVLIFRNGPATGAVPTPEQIQDITAQWMNWMGSIAAQNKLVDKGNRLGVAGAKVVKANQVVTDGPYTEIKEFISGYTIIKTATIDEAVEIAKGCPIFNMGGNVEVRTLVNMDDNS